MNQQSSTSGGKLSLDENKLMQELMNAFNRLQVDPTADPSEIRNLEKQISQLICKNLVIQEDPNNDFMLVQRLSDDQRNKDNDSKTNTSSHPDEEWFPYKNDFNQRAESTGGNGTFNFESGRKLKSNNDCEKKGVLLSLDDAILMQELGTALNRLKQDPTADPIEIQNLENQLFQLISKSFQKSIGGQHQSSSLEYASFEMPTVISTNLDAGPYQDYRIDDPNSFYASQQSSSSQGNDMLLQDNYDMMVQQTAHVKIVDHMNSSKAGNPSSHSGMNQQNKSASRAKLMKKSLAKKKSSTSASDTVGRVLQKVANRNSQKVENDNEKKGEIRLSLDDTFLMQELGNALNRLKQDPSADPIEIQNLENQLCQLISKNMMPQEDPNNGILDQIINRTATASRAKLMKRSSAKKKPTKSASDTVGIVLQKVANRNSQQVEGDLRLSLDDTILMQELGNALNRLKQDPTADPIEIQNLENQLFQLISKSFQ